jgi:hypothetical protein
MTWGQFYFYWLPPLMRRLRLRRMRARLDALKESRWHTEEEILGLEDEITMLEQRVEWDEEADRRARESWPESSEGVDGRE